MKHAYVRVPLAVSTTTHSILQALSVLAAALLSLSTLIAAPPSPRKPTVAGAPGDPSISRTRIIHRPSKKVSPVLCPPNACLPALKVSGDGVIAVNPAIARTRRGNGLCAWQQLTSGTLAAGTYELSCASYDTFNNRWRKPKNLSAGSPAAGDDARDPQVALDKCGHGMAIWRQTNWYDETSSTTAYNIIALPYTLNWARGEHLLDPHNISLDQTANADLPNLKISACCQGLVAWQETHATNVTHVTITGVTDKNGTLVINSGTGPVTVSIEQSIAGTLTIVVPKDGIVNGDVYIATTSGVTVGNLNVVVDGGSVNGNIHAAEYLRNANFGTIDGDVVIVNNGTVDTLACDNGGNITGSVIVINGGTVTSSMSVTNEGSVGFDILATNSGVGTIGGALYITNSGTVDRDVSARNNDAGAIVGNLDITNSGAVGQDFNVYNGCYMGGNLNVVNTGNIGRTLNATNDGEADGTFDVTNNGAVVGDIHTTNGHYVAGNLSVINGGTVGQSISAVSVYCVGGNFDVVNDGSVAQNVDVSNENNGEIFGQLDVTISGTVGQDVTMTNDGTIDNGNLTVTNDGNVAQDINATNNGTLKTGNLGVINGSSGTVGRNVTVTNNGAIDNGGFTITNSGTVSGYISMYNHKTLTKGGIDLTNNGAVVGAIYAYNGSLAEVASMNFTNVGTVESHVHIETAGHIRGNMVATNRGMINGQMGTFTSDASSVAGDVTLDNYGTIGEDMSAQNGSGSSSTFSIGGSITATNYAGGLINQGSYITNYGSVTCATNFENQGTIGPCTGGSTNCGIGITNWGTIGTGAPTGCTSGIDFLNTGSILGGIPVAITNEANHSASIINVTNKGTLGDLDVYNYGTVDQGVVFDNKADASLDNLVIENGGIVSKGGILVSNEGTINSDINASNNDGSIKHNDSAITVSNAANIGGGVLLRPC